MKAETATTNQIIEEFCLTKRQVQFVDLSSRMLESQGRPRRDLLNWDGLHPSKRCYALWTSIIHPILMKRFAASESACQQTLKSKDMTRRYGELLMLRLSLRA